MGRRVLLVFHWTVESGAGTELTTTMFGELKANPTIVRSEVLRRSMIKLISDDNKPDYAHPPFGGLLYLLAGAGGINEPGPELINDRF